MAELRPTDYHATIKWLGTVPIGRTDIRAQSVPQVNAFFSGLEDDYHSGLTRASCVRVRDQHPKGTEIRNTRQLSILSSEEMAEIAALIDLEALDPSLLGASMVIEGIPDFTFVPPGSRLQTETGTTIVIDVENGPCNGPAKEIEKDAEGHGKAFKAAARGKRGVTAWIQCEGVLIVGEKLRLHVPNQRAWAG